MLKNGAHLVERDLGRNPLTEDELKELYRTMKMAENPPAPAEAIRLMARNPNLIRRPIVVHGRDAVLGFDEKALLRLVGSSQKRFITR